MKLWWLLTLTALSCKSSTPTSAPASVQAQSPDAPPTSSASPPPAARALGVRLTPKIAAACGPDYLERHATSVSDLDGDGKLDRPSIVRAADAIVVRLHQLPSLRETGSWKLVPNGYLELATPRRRGSTRGDLWITVGANVDKPWDGSNAPWKETLYRLEGGKLVAITSGYRDMRIRVDVDGDGRVDPIGSAGGKVRALLAGDRWLELPVVISSRVHGASVANQQQEAIDLDGNGVRELVIEKDDAVSIVEVPSLREVWSAKGKPWKPQLIRWGGAFVLVVMLDEQLRVYATDAKHALIAKLPGAASYSEVPAAIAGEDGSDSLLVVTGHPWQLFSRKNPMHPRAKLAELVARLDQASAPFGPLRLAASDAPGLVVASREPGEPIRLELVDPRTRARRRTIWQSDSRISLTKNDIHVSLVDLDRDGASEILLEETTSTAFHHGASWNTYQLRLVDGQAKLLWQEPSQRVDHWVHDGPRGAMRQTQVDGTHVRAFDLGDGTMPLRIRSARDEYYVLAASSKLETIPVCLE
jgi:hypothetical protein